MNIGNRIRLATNVLFGKNSSNKFNSAFLKYLGGGYTAYDENAKTYINKGYNYNPFVYSVVNQIATKTSSIPFYIKKIEDKTQKTKRDLLLKSTNYNLSAQQRIKNQLLESKAFDNDYLEMPLERPNPFQTWSEFLELYEVFIKCTGNIYIYLLSPENGINAGEPMAWYLLPSHLMQIVVKKDVDYNGIESPISHYILTEGEQFIKFEKDNVVHIKYANPNYDQEGSHLYGQAPLRAMLRNIQSSNEAIDLNNKTLLSGGAFGLIHSKGNTPLTQEQAKGLKERLLEMDKDSGRLGKLAGISAEVGFTRLSLTSDELKPFAYLSFDLKQVCNALGWDDKLMGNDTGAKYDNYISAQKKVLIGSVLPDLKLLEQAINSEILPRYKKYKSSFLEFDISELPEMQTNMKELVEWTTRLKDKGVMTGNEVRISCKLPVSENPLMDEYTTIDDLMTLEQSLEDLPTIQ